MLWCFNLPTHLEVFLPSVKAPPFSILSEVLQNDSAQSSSSGFQKLQASPLPALVSMSFITERLIQVHVLLWAWQGAASWNGWDWAGSNGNGGRKLILQNHLFVFFCLSGSLATSQFLILTWLSSSFCRPQVWVFLDSYAKPEPTPISLPPKGLLKRINHFWSACYLWVFFWNLLCNFADFTWAKGASGISYLAASWPLFLYWNAANNVILSLFVHCFQVFCQRRMLL